MKEESIDKIYNVLGVKLYGSTIKRYFAMVNICLLGLGTFVCFDIVGALQTALQDKFEINFSEFSLMYSVNCWANTVISPFGGFLIDRVFGIRIGTIFYGVVFLVGHLIFSLGVTLVVFWCTLFGRFINGVGHEFLYIGMQLYAVRYFKGKELSMVMCITVSMARLGSSLAYSISEPLLIFVRSFAPGKEDVGIVTFIAGSFTVLTVATGVILLIMTPKTNEEKKKNGVTEAAVQNELAHPQAKLVDVLYLPLEFWCCILIQVSFAISIYVFLPYTQKLFQTVNGLTIKQANEVTSFFNIIGVVVAPVIGIVVHKVGREVYVVHVGILTAFIAHLIMGFTTWTPYLGMFLLSLSYGLFNGSVLPMMAMLIPEYKLGTAYGVVMAFSNGGYALCVYLVGLTIDKYHYIGLAVFMLASVAGGGIISIYLFYIDRQRKGTLNISSTERNALFDKTNEKDNEAAEPLKGQTIELIGTKNQN